MSKSEMIPIGEVNNVNALAEILGCSVGSLPMTYLGMPLVVSPLFGIPYWKKIELNLVVWEKLYLSKGGGLALLKSTLSSIPTYFFNSFHHPYSCC